jgi:hypothetical protein
MGALTGIDLFQDKQKMMFCCERGDKRSGFI